MLNDIYQDPNTGEYYTYIFYEVISEKHCLINGTTKVFLTNEELNEFERIETGMSDGY